MKKKSRGRPAIVIPKDDIRKAREMAGIGLNLKQIAKVLGMSPRTLDNRIAEDKKRFEDGKSDGSDETNIFCAIEKGRAEGDAKLSRAAFKMAVSGKHPALTIFLCKVRLGWRDSERVDVKVGLEKMDDRELLELGQKALETLKRAE